MAGDGAARGVAPCGVGSLVRGFYIDDRHVNVPGIDCYDPPATQDSTAFVTCAVKGGAATAQHGYTVKLLQH